MSRSVLDGQLVAGTRLGRYEIVELLAFGGMAEIYLARAIGLYGFEKPVVLKRVPPHYAHDDSFVSMFVNEARIAARLHHPNLAQVYDIGSDGTSCYFAMEYVNGKNIAQILTRARKLRRDVPLDIAIAVIMQVAAGLHAAHEQRGHDDRLLDIVHRDISPTNVLVTHDGCAKLIDFGIAKAAKRRTTTEVGVIKGKYAYMSPEQCQGGELDRRSDLFSLGIVLFELTTGTRLFVGDNHYLVMRSLLKEPLPRPSDRRADYPPELERIALRALSRDPNQRYQTAEALYRDLDQCARQCSLSVTPYDVSAFMRGLFSAPGADRADTDTEPVTETPPALRRAETVEGPPTFRALPSHRPVAAACDGGSPRVEADHSAPGEVVIEVNTYPDDWEHAFTAAQMQLHFGHQPELVGDPPTPMAQGSTPRLDTRAATETAGATSDTGHATDRRGIVAILVAGVIALALLAAWWATAGGLPAPF